MKKLIIALLFSSTTAFAQNTVEVYNDSYSQYFYKNLDSKLIDFDFKSLKNEDEKILRIWRENEVFILGNKSYYIASYKDKITGFIYKFKYKLDKVTFQDLTLESLKELDNFYDIDSKPIMIEFAENKNYFTRVFNINSTINNKISTLLKAELLAKKQEFEKQLPGGNYQIGSKILTIEVDKNILPKVANTYSEQELN